jgi:hypothetical protein
LEGFGLKSLAQPFPKVGVFGATFPKGWLVEALLLLLIYHPSFYI